eukprot:361704-Chlamydomonas_euryale.AAC.3
MFSPFGGTWCEFDESFDEKFGGVCGYSAGSDGCFQEGGEQQGEAWGGGERSSNEDSPQTSTPLDACLHLWTPVHTTERPSTPEKSVHTFGRPRPHPRPGVHARRRGGGVPGCRRRGGASVVDPRDAHRRHHTRAGAGVEVWEHRPRGGQAAGAGAAGSIGRGEERLMTSHGCVDAWPSKRVCGC